MTNEFKGNVVNTNQKVVEKNTQHSTGLNIKIGSEIKGNANKKQNVEVKKRINAQHSGGLNLNIGGEAKGDAEVSKRLSANSAANADSNISASKNAKSSAKIYSQSGSDHNLGARISFGFGKIIFRFDNQNY